MLVGESWDRLGLRGYAYCWCTARYDSSYFSQQKSAILHCLACVANINSTKCCRTVMFEILCKCSFVLRFLF